MRSSPGGVRSVRRCSCPWVLSAGWPLCMPARTQHARAHMLAHDCPTSTPHADEDFGAAMHCMMHAWGTGPPVHASPHKPPLLHSTPHLFPTKDALEDPNQQLPRPVDVRYLRDSGLCLAAKDLLTRPAGMQRPDIIRRHGSWRERRSPHMTPRRSESAVRQR